MSLNSEKGFGIKLQFLKSYLGFLLMARHEWLWSIGAALISNYMLLKHVKKKRFKV